MDLEDCFLVSILELYTVVSSVFSVPVCSDLCFVLLLDHSH